MVMITIFALFNFKMWFLFSNHIEIVTIYKGRQLGAL